MCDLAKMIDVKGARSGPADKATGYKMINVLIGNARARLSFWDNINR